MSENRGEVLQDETKLSLIKSLLEDKKAEDLVMLDLRGLSSVTDTLVVASGHSDRHVQAVSESLAQEMKNRGYMPLGLEGLKDGRWALLDYGDVVVHIFYHEIRLHYDLEGVWRDAPIILDQRRDMDS
ncbi:MAG: ribosome silencing factor [Deltaproteobacteria bacterium]|nr:ribosome silencing factor [Candidatus Tharpella sp.]